MNLDILFQKNAARDLLKGLEIISPHSILAGGAPRDWFFGRKANDLDFYFSVEESLTQRAVQGQLNQVLPKNVEFIEAKDFPVDPMYKHMENLKRIWYLEYKGIPVQLIQMKSAPDVFGVVDKMSCSICKVWWKNGDIVPEKDFILTLTTKYMFLNEGYTWEDLHPQKMEQRFKGEFHRATKKQAETRFFNKAISEARERIRATKIDEKVGGEYDEN